MNDDDDLYFISIIIPVYNVEKYLRQCVDSILTQDFRRYELILVDDGSNDKSPAICDDYRAKDDRVKVIHKKNAGASDARNAGMLAAAGTYLYFMDADDFLAEGSLRKAAETIEADGECDIILLSSADVSADGSYRNPNYQYHKSRIYKKSQDEVLAYFMSNGRFPIPPWIKLIRRQLVVDNDISFTKGLACCNDLDHMIGLILTAQTFNYCDFPFYYYRCGREGSLSGSRSEKLFTSLLYVTKKWFDLSRSDYGKYASVIHEILVNQYGMLLCYYYNLGKSEKVIYKNEMNKYAVLMSTSKSKNVILANIVYKVFGINLVSGLINFYYVSIKKKKSNKRK